MNILWMVGELQKKCKYRYMGIFALIHADEFSYLKSVKIISWSGKSQGRVREFETVVILATLFDGKVVD